MSDTGQPEHAAQPRWFILAGLGPLINHPGGHLSTGPHPRDDRRRVAVDHARDGRVGADRQLDAGRAVADDLRRRAGELVGGEVTPAHAAKQLGAGADRRVVRREVPVDRRTSAGVDEAAQPAQSAVAVQRSCATPCRRAEGPRDVRSPCRGAA